MDGPLLVVDRDDSTPIGVQLVDGLRRGILSGALRAGDVMPSTRVLATELGVARSSVVQAYDQLAGEGYLSTRQGAPTRVAELERHPADAHAPGSAPSDPRSRNTGPLDTEPLDADERPYSVDPVVIDLSPGVPSLARLDERVWRAAWRAAGSAPVSADSPPRFGLPELQRAIADHLRYARGVACSPDDIVVTAGTGEATALVAMALTESLGRPPHVAVEHPGYPTARRTLARRGAVLRAIPVLRDGIDVDALADLADDDPAAADTGGGSDTAGGLDAVVVTPSHQYPLGGRLPVADRLALLDLADRNGWLVIEDDYDSEFRHTGAPLPALASLDRGGRVALIGSFSKVLTPSLRLGYLVLPNEHATGASGRRFRDAVAAIRRDELPPVPGPVQHAMAHLLETGALRRHIAATRREYAHRRRLVIQRLDGCPGAELTALEGGLHAVVTLPSAEASARVVDRLRAEGVVVAPLSMYAVEGALAGPAGFVIGYAGVSDTALDGALRRIRAAVLDG
ncbi:PLP-dependent aminotransferase family protein [Agromyces sp. LHK192]|uniref:MocR-like pyridoxine biosynthesis transcription factor PdxR n=1 Tax=Agromyces sp. LHK192 TaxID=2498704 RepID=UPI000FDBEED7|nr:PLP-dependent aminotransferase family protein [Agromyces sp. LHK192]